MDEVPGLKLIQAVDPTKIKVTINEKFAKLTLSSNKKKKLPPEKPIPVDPIEVEKRRSASRNLLSELSEFGNTETENSNALCVNAILRSSSLTSDDNEVQNKTESFSKLFDFKVENISTNAESMERLQLSADMESENDIMDEIAQKVSDMTVSNLNVPPRSSPNIIELLSSSEDENDHTSEDEESVISVSDSSKGSIVKDCFKDYNFMVTSDIRSSTETEGPSLPSTLSNECADRIEAFLRDVSQEQRNMQVMGRLLDDDSMILDVVTPIKKMEKKSNLLSYIECAKAKMIATAETESMSPLDPETDPDAMLKPKNMALDDTEAISESAEVSFFPQESECVKKSNEENEADESKRRYANDDTEANTTNDSLENTHHSDVHLVEDSIIISETSCDDITNSSHDTSKSATPEKQELVPSEEVLSASLRKDSKDSSTSSQYGLSIGRINIAAKINIKLKINADLSISDEGSSDVKESSTSSVADLNDETDNDGGAERNDKTNQSDDIPTMSEHLDPSKGSTEAEMSPEAVITYEKVEVVENNVNFMSHAQKLLTELYGNSWKTPEVIRTLKRTSQENRSHSQSKTDEKKSSSKKAIPAETTVAGQQKAAEESALDDFSMFRKDIDKTHMDSTRLMPPKPRQGKKLFAKSILAEPKTTPRKQVTNAFKLPQSDFKKKPSAKKQNKEGWRKIVDTDSESEDNNITDDVDADQTVLTDDDDEKQSNASDSSWHKSDGDSSEDDDYEAPTINVTKPRTKIKAKRKGGKSSEDELIYLDLSKDEIEVVEERSPAANKDENFEKNLSKILSSFRYEDKPKIDATPKSTGKSKRRLFTVSYSDEIEEESIVAICRGEAIKKPTNPEDDDYSENVRFNGEPIPPSFNIYNKHLEAVKASKPVFKITPTREKTTPRTPISNREERTPFKNNEKIIYQTPSAKDKRRLDELYSTPSFKYSFLKSLDVCVGKSLCHPDAIVFRENYRQKKEDLANILYELYNAKLFDNNLNVPLVWNKKLSNTAGRCLNKKTLGKRLSVIELSDKVLTSADRLRCTLIHELCHAATWIFNGEGGHGAKWKEWARKANATFPDLPKIGVCHQYDIEYKYTYKCTLCNAKSYYHSKSKKVDNIRCSYCHGTIEIFLNKKDKEGNIMPTPVKEPTGFAKFVKEKYQQYKRPDMKHADVMKLLSNEFAALKVAGNAK